MYQIFILGQTDDDKATDKDKPPHTTATRQKT
jgi:hypothetical protein